MPCSDSSSSIFIKLDHAERFVSFQFAKITCGREITAETEFSKYLKGKTIDEIQRRLSIWCDRGKHELEDVAAYHLQLGEQQLFTDPVKSQPTWNKLIRIVLSAGGVPLDLEIVKAYQQDRFGRWNGDTCLMELLPLPSRSTGDWLYSNLSAVPHLTTREVYR